MKNYWLDRKKEREEKNKNNVWSNFCVVSTTYVQASHTPSYSFVIFTNPGKVTTNFIAATNCTYNKNVNYGLVG